MNILDIAKMGKIQQRNAHYILNINLKFQILQSRHDFLQAGKALSKLQYDAWLAMMQEHRTKLADCRENNLISTNSPQNGTYVSFCSHGSIYHRNFFCVPPSCRFHNPNLPVNCIVVNTQCADGYTSNSFLLSIFAWLSMRIG